MGESMCDRLAGEQWKLWSIYEGILVRQGAWIGAGTEDFD